MISKLWLSWEKTSTTEQEKRACSDVCWNCGAGEIQCQQEAGKGGFGPNGDTLGIKEQTPSQFLAVAPTHTDSPVHTPSFLSRSSAPCRKSRDTSSFSSSHWITKGSNQLEERPVPGEASQPRGHKHPIRGPLKGCTHAGYSGTRLLKEGSSVTYSLYSHFTLKCRFM